MTYNAAGWLTHTTEPDGFQTDATYDALGQVLETNFEGAASGYSPGCDECLITNTYFDSGALKTTTRSGETLEIKVNADNQVTQVLGGQAGDTSYNYDAAGRLSDMTTPAATGMTIYSYNDLGLLKSVDDPFVSGGVTAYSYDCLGRIIARGGTQQASCVASSSQSPDAGGMVWQRSYEPGTGRIAAQSISTGGTCSVSQITGCAASVQLTYDSLGNVKTRNETVDDAAAGSTATEGSGRWVYDYDDASRLLKAVQEPTRANGTLTLDPDDGPLTTTYTYDRAGNRTKIQEPGEDPRTMIYDDAGLPKQAQQGLAITKYSYDESGHLRSVNAPEAADDRCYSYNGFGELSSAGLDDDTECGPAVGDLKFTYDAFSRQLTREATGADPSMTEFTYQGTGEDLAKATDTVAGTTNYLTTPMGPLAQQTVNGDGSKVGFYMKDLHGDVVGMANTADDQTMGQLYSPYGEPMPASGAAESRLGFQGDYTDEGTGLVDMGARLYDPTLGMFTSRDTAFGDLKNPSSLNQYSYGSGNPVSMVDPTGQAATWAQYWAQAARYTAAWAHYAEKVVLWTVAWIQYQVAVATWTRARITYLVTGAWPKAVSKKQPTFNRAFPSAPRISWPTAPPSSRSSSSSARMTGAWFLLGSLVGGSSPGGIGVDSFPMPENAEYYGPAIRGVGLRFRVPEGLAGGGNGLADNIMELRSMEATDRYPYGYARYYGANENEPLNPLTGKPDGTRAETHYGYPKGHVPPTEDDTGGGGSDEGSPDDPPDDTGGGCSFGGIQAAGACGVSGPVLVPGGFSPGLVPVSPGVGWSPAWMPVPSFVLA